jgi:hypothetical protein
MLDFGSGKLVSSSSSVFRSIKDSLQADIVGNMWEQIIPQIELVCPEWIAILRAVAYSQ